MRNVEATSFFEITGRGRAYNTVQADPPYELGEHVILDNCLECVVRGVEAFATMHGRDPGQPIALLLEFVEEADRG